MKPTPVLNSNGKQITGWDLTGFNYEYVSGQRVAEARGLLELFQGFVGGSHGDRGDTGPHARALGELLDPLDGCAELEMDAEIDSVAEVAGGVAQVADDQSESCGQRQGHADDDEGERGGEGRARKPAQRAEQRLQMARAIGGNGAAHV